MANTARTTQVRGIYEIIGQLINTPKSLGLREHLPPRVVAALTSTREILREEMNGRMPMAGEENDLADELSQDADTQHGIPGVLEVTQENLATAAKPELKVLAATV